MKGNDTKFVAITAFTVTHTKNVVLHMLFNSFLASDDFCHPLMFESAGSCLNTRSLGRVFKHLLRELASVDITKQTYVIFIHALYLILT